MGLAGDGGGVLEAGVVVKDGSTVVLCDGCGDQVDDTRCPVVPTGGHPDLDVPGTLSDRLGDRQHDVETLTPLGDDPDVGKVATRNNQPSGLTRHLQRKNCRCCSAIQIAEQQGDQALFHHGAA